MYFLPVSITLFLLFLLLMPLLFVIAPGVAFSKLGFDPLCGYAFFLLCLLGSGLNIPVRRERVRQAASLEDMLGVFARFFRIRTPRFRERIIAVNLGGAVLPSILSLYLLLKVPLSQVIMATTITSLVSYKVSRPVKGVGIVLPALVPPVIAAVTALVLARENAPHVAYISGVMGTLIGADFFRLNQIKRMDAPFLSIGGAGVFDGVYLVGLVSVLLA